MADIPLRNELLLGTVSSLVNVNWLTDRMDKKMGRVMTHDSHINGTRRTAIIMV